jgi:uncharacterized membrane protein
MKQFDNTIPFGFKTNPSLWKKRIILLILAAVGFCVALYLGLYELKMFPHVWEPFFGNGTNEVLRSSFSRSLPIPDGLLGAFGYLCDIILVSIGSEIRWKSKPWVVILYSILVVMMGLVSIFLLILQAFIVNAWCTLCLVSTALSLSMVIPVMHELSASLHYIKKEKRNGQSFWNAVGER